MTTPFEAKFGAWEPDAETIANIEARSVGQHKPELVRAAAKIAEHYRDTAGDFSYDVTISDLGAIVITASAGERMKRYFAANVR